MPGGRALFSIFLNTGSSNAASTSGVAREEAAAALRSSCRMTVAWTLLHGPGQFPGNLPLTRKQKQLLKEYQESMAKDASDPASDDNIGAVQAVANDAEVVHNHKLLKRAIETRFAEMRRAFQFFDRDGSITKSAPQRW